MSLIDDALPIAAVGAAHDPGDRLRGALTALAAAGWLRRPEAREVACPAASPSTGLRCDLRAGHWPLTHQHHAAESDAVIRWTGATW